MNTNKTVKKPSLSKDSILSHLKSNINIFCFDTVDSTNNEAKRKSDTLSSTPTLFVANHQSSGKGRLGRNFYSPKNMGLYMSLMLKANDNIEDTVCMTTATALCVVKSLENLCNIQPKIKWVNDIYLDNKKICGILCEAITDEKNFRVKGIIIGIGINISTVDFPDDIKSIASSIGQDIDKCELCAKICDNIIDIYENIKDRSFIDEYKSRSLVLDKKISYTEFGETKSAHAIGIDKNGGLIIQTNEGTKILSTGEITVRVDEN